MELCPLGLGCQQGGGRRSRLPSCPRGHNAVVPHDGYLTSRQHQNAHPARCLASRRWRRPGVLDEASVPCYRLCPQIIPGPTPVSQPRLRAPHGRQQMQQPRWPDLCFQLLHAQPGGCLPRSGVWLQPCPSGPLCTSLEYPRHFGRGNGARFRHRETERLQNPH